MTKVTFFRNGQQTGVNYLKAEKAERAINAWMARGADHTAQKEAK